ADVAQDADLRREEAGDSMPLGSDPAADAVLGCDVAHDVAQRYDIASELAIRQDAAETAHQLMRGRVDVRYADVSLGSNHTAEGFLRRNLADKIATADNLPGNSLVGVDGRRADDDAAGVGHRQSDVTTGRLNGAKDRPVRVDVAEDTGSRHIGDAGRGRQGQVAEPPRTGDRRGDRLGSLNGAADARQGDSR